MSEIHGLENSIAIRLSQGVDPDNIQETEASMMDGANEIAALQAEIGRLTAERDRLRAALQLIVVLYDEQRQPVPAGSVRVELPWLTQARAALAQQEDSHA